MKKIIAIALIFALAGAFTACKKLDTTDTNSITKRPYYVDTDGSTIYAEAQKNEDGEIEFYVTNANGESSKLDKDELVIEEITNADQYLEILDMIENNPEQIVEETPPVNLEIADGVIPDENFEKVDVELDENGKPAHDNLTYQEILESGKFTIEATIQTETTEGTVTCPFVITKSGDAAYIEATIPVQDTNGSIKAGILSNDKATYLLVPSIRAYLAVDDLTLNELFPMDEIMKDDSTNESYSYSGKVEYNGKTYTCDIYENDGATVKYFYDESGNIARIESSDGNQTVITEIKSLSNTADESKLVLPKSYLDFTSFSNGDVKVNELLA